MARDHEDSLEPWTSELYGTDGYDDESHLEETDWTEDLYETDDYDPNDSTFSDHYPALLGQIVDTQEGDTSKLETVQEAVAAANAAADTSRRTGTQARQLVKDVHRSRGFFPVSKGNMMEVDQGKGKSRGKKGRSSKGKGKRQGKSKGKKQGETSWTMSLVSDLTGLVIVLHTMIERASVSTHLARETRTLHRFDRLTWKATSMIGLQVQVLLQEMSAQGGLRLTSHPVSPLRFSFANGQEDVSTSGLLVPYLHWKVVFYSRVMNAPGPVLLGADVHEDLGLVVDHVDCSVFLSHLKLEDTVERLPSRHLALSLRTDGQGAV